MFVFHTDEDDQRMTLHSTFFFGLDTREDVLLRRRHDGSIAITTAADFQLESHPTATSQSEHARRCRIIYGNIWRQWDMIQIIIEM